MILKVFAVFDAAIGAYMPPFFMQSRGQAIRSFTDMARTQGSPSQPNLIENHPHDFRLFELGDYNDATAGFDMYDSPVSLGGAHELLEPA